MGEGDVVKLSETVANVGNGLLRFSGEAPGLSGTGARGGGRELASGDEEEENDGRKGWA